MSGTRKFSTSGFEIAPVYDLNRGRKAYELPGEYPFTRGIHPQMYRTKLWTIRQYAGFGTAKETNERFRYLLGQGTTGLSVAFDLPTQMGHDSDSPFAKGEVGRVGVAIDTLEDMEALFDGIKLDRVSTSMTINSTAFILLAFYLALAKRQGISFDKLQGTVQNDILKEYIARGTYIYPPRAALRLVTDLCEFCRDNVPRWNSISISGYHIREAGSTAVQEVAFTLADGIAYVGMAIARGMEIDSFAPRLAFFFNCHNNFLEEVAKFRAARRVWAHIMRELFSAKDPASWALRYHTQTAGSTLAAKQPEVNLIRTTIQAMAAVCGGTQSLHTNSFDEALGLPTENAAKLALRTQQVIALESGLVDTADPLGGSYVVEALTDEIERGVFEYLNRIEKMGGMLAAIEMGFPQQEIEEAAYVYQKGLDSGDIQIVGVNTSVEPESEMVPVMKVDPNLEREQIERLCGFKSRRDSAAATVALDGVKSAAEGEQNIMPFVISAVESGATLGEISGKLREVFGEHR